MSSAFWEQVVADGLPVPPDRPLDELTAELTTMLGDPDPGVRDGDRLPTLTTWIRAGVYDDLLPGLGDGMCAGLDVGLRRERHRHGLPPQLLRAGAHRVRRAATTVADLLTADQVLALGRPPRWLAGCASGTCAASCPARAGPTPSPTARTRSAPWRGRRAWAGSS